MAHADKLRIVDDAKSRRIDREWAKQFKRLSGFDWPPKDSAEWTIILTRAGWSQHRIEQFLCTIGVEGFDDAGELPQSYVSVPHGDWPIFSASLVAGLERWRKDNQAGFVPNVFQHSILVALDGRAMNKQALADEVCKGDGKRLYKPGGLTELRGAGLVAHKHGLGFYRPDAPPVPAAAPK
jgi:hypothetical protein